MAPLFACGLLLFALGLVGLLVRRSWLTALTGGLLAIVGAALVLGHFAVVRQDARGLAAAVLLVILGSALTAAGTGLAIALYRRRGTVNIDELRELGG